MCAGFVFIWARTYTYIPLMFFIHVLLNNNSRLILSGYLIRGFVTRFSGSEDDAAATTTCVKIIVFLGTIETKQIEYYMKPLF